MARIVLLKSPAVGNLVVYEGPLYMIRTEDGDQATFNWLIGVTVDGVEYQHPHTFRQNNEYGAKCFLQRIIQKGEINLDHWIELEPRPSLEESLWNEYVLELEDRMAHGAIC